LGAEFAISWEYSPNGYETALKKKQDGFKLVALETTNGAVSLFDFAGGPEEEPILLIVGNEISGVDPGILSLCDASIFIPMLGYKRSLNVAVAFGIAVYTIQFRGETHSTSIDPLDQSQ
jgi:tRNA G18 (ribose-2'-O)-methylase SpoU